MRTIIEKEKFQFFIITTTTRTATTTTTISYCIILHNTMTDDSPKGRLKFQLSLKTVKESGEKSKAKKNQLDNTFPIHKIGTKII